MEFSRQEYWSCHFLLQGILPTQGLNLGPLCATVLPGKPKLEKNKNSFGKWLSVILCECLCVKNPTSWLTSHRRYRCVCACVCVCVCVHKVLIFYLSIWLRWESIQVAPKEAHLEALLASICQWCKYSNSSGNPTLLTYFFNFGNT